MEQNELTMPTKYDPQSIEQGRYKWWLDGKYFEAQDDDSKQPYTIVIPPPNVTGKTSLRTCLGYDASRYFNKNEADARI